MGGGKVKGQLSVVTSVGRKRMGKAPAVQSGRALPMGRCASPPWQLCMTPCCIMHIFWGLSINDITVVEAGGAVPHDQQC